jgi:hypothetical protein
MLRPMRASWRRLRASRRASVGLNMVILFGTPVLLHVFAGMDRFADGAAWYWAYGAVACLGVWLLVSGLRESSPSDQQG